MLKDPVRYVRYCIDKTLSVLRSFLLLAPDVSAGRTARELWWTSKDLSSPSLSMLAYHSGDEQKARWWSQF
jgi:hypothetical protein